MSQPDGLVFAALLERKGGGTEIGWDDVRRWRSEDGLLWLHLDYESPRSLHWLSAESGLPAVAAEALTADETRPRSVQLGNGLLLILRGVNLNPGADLEDMVSIRLWIEQDRIITLRHRKVMAIQDIRSEVAAGNGPTDAGGFLVELADRLLVRMGTALADIEEELDTLEDAVLGAESYDLRTRIGEMRRKVIRIRRYLAPQREVMAHLHGERMTWLEDRHRMLLRELADRVTRYVEDLDAIKDRAAVAQDELGARLSEQMNKTMYVLSIVAAIFLPLGLLTGLLGINVGGIPGTENHWAFVIVCGLLLVIAIVQTWLFRRMRWI
jgi:zinc transporter